MFSSTLPAVQFGASYFDADTGLRVFHLHPKLHPTMWKQFVAGAVERYSEYGYEDILDEELRSGRTTDAFTFMLHGDTPVGGVRTRMVRSIGESAFAQAVRGTPAVLATVCGGQ